MVVDAERALVGSAAHCEVRLDPEVAAAEHVEVYASGGVIHFAARGLGLTAPPQLDRVTTTEGRWNVGAVLSISGIELTLLPEVPHGSAGSCGRAAVAGTCGGAATDPCCNWRRPEGVASVSRLQTHGAGLAGSSRCHCSIASGS